MKGYAELNFVFEFPLGRKGLIDEIEEELDIMLLVMEEKHRLGAEYNKMLEKILVMPLRKLLFKNQGEYLLEKVCPDFKMPKLNGTINEYDDKLFVVNPPYKLGEYEDWVDLNTWGEQVMAYFYKSKDNLPEGIQEFVFNGILNKLRGPEKTEFSSLFHKEETIIEGESISLFVRNNAEDEIQNSRIFELMKKAGYYDLTLYTFLKGISDKKGAHIDINNSPMFSVINTGTNELNSPVLCFAFQLIYAIKKQIPEFVDYWRESDEFFDAIK